MYDMIMLYATNMNNEEDCQISPVQFIKQICWEAPS